MVAVEFDDRLLREAQSPGASPPGNQLLEVLARWDVPARRPGGHSRQYGPGTGDGINLRCWPSQLHVILHGSVNWESGNFLRGSCSTRILAGKQPEPGCAARILVPLAGSGAIRGRTWRRIVRIRPAGHTRLRPRRDAREINTGRTGLAEAWRKLVRSFRSPARARPVLVPPWNR